MKPCAKAGTTPDSLSQPRLDAAAKELRDLLDAGEATRGLDVNLRRGALVLSRSRADALSAEPRSDRRFRLTPLGSGQFGLSLYRRNRWERLPFQGTSGELAEVMNTALAHWAAAW